jgi:hypothetical protein
VTLAREASTDLYLLLALHFAHKPIHKGSKRGSRIARETPLG